MNETTPSTLSRQNRGLLGADLDNIFEGFFRPIQSLDRAESNSDNMVPAVDVVEDDKQYVVTAELPGVDRKDIDVSVTDGVLTLNAERKAEQEDKDEKGRIIRRESRYGSYYRSMRLDNSIDVGKVKATHNNGILKLVLPKSEEAKPKKIQVDVS